jgi:hypothetical protein
MLLPSCCSRPTEKIVEIVEFLLNTVGVSKNKLWEKVKPFADPDMNVVVLQ